MSSLQSPHKSIPAFEQLLRDLRCHNSLSHLDIYLAGFLMAEASKPSKALILAIALTSHATSEGHVCLDLNALAGRELFATPERVIQAPPLAEWRSALLESGVVTPPGAWQPLVLDRQNRLYLYRYWDYEQRLSKALIQRSQQERQSVDYSCLSDGLDALFEASKGQVVDWQKSAAATAVLRNLSVISGGPGTGKTSTVVRILALLRQQPEGTHLRIALTAPTGMAAARLQQSIRASKSGLPLSKEQLDAIPEQASTLHRLLGVQRQGTGFRYHRENPLLFDVVILDEASMVDVALMTKLIDALPGQARLILLGDRDQLASVEAGSVLGDICLDCDAPDPSFALKLEQLTKQPIQSASIARNILSNSVVLLRHSYRFAAQSPIGKLSRAVNHGEVTEAIGLLRTSAEEDELGWLAGKDHAIAMAATHFATLFAQIKAGAEVKILFETLQKFRILCALREGPFGVRQLNLAITQRLKEQGFIPDNREWYIGRPVMLTRNDYQLNLYNGETGIVLPHPDQPSELSVAFIGRDTDIHWVPPSRLPFCETVYALTVHKSQGSEFQQVLLLLPDRDAPIVCRELLYTAITRSKSQFRLVGPESVFKTAVGSRMKRVSGLADLLRNPH
jgi:exodeoxyribonuclease V alpha subunit